MPLFFRERKNQKREIRLNILLILLATLIAIAGIVYFSPVRDFERAASLLLRVEDSSRAQWLSHLGTYAVEERVVSLPGPEGPLPARLYLPKARKFPPALV